MSRIDVTITTPDGACPATLHVPDTPAPATIMYVDAAGVRETFLAMADRLAAAGVRATMETYPAAHGFAVPDNATHDPAADERHWAATTALFDRYLR